MIIFFHVTPPTEPFSLSLHDALPISIRSVGADLSYDITEINAKAGTQFTLEYANESNMPHNMVFVNSEADINPVGIAALQDRKSTRLNSSHVASSYAVICLKKKKKHG